MPIYEYKCEVCGRTFDVQQRFTDPPIEHCEFCRGPVKRVFSPVGIVFKGSGFYATDSRKEKETPKKPPAKETPKKKETKAPESS